MKSRVHDDVSSADVDVNVYTSVLAHVWSIVFLENKLVVQDTHRSGFPKLLNCNLDNLARKDHPRIVFRFIALFSHSPTYGIPSLMEKRHELYILCVRKGVEVINWMAVVTWCIEQAINNLVLVTIDSFILPFTLLQPFSGLLSSRLPLWQLQGSLWCWINEFVGY